MTKSLRVKRIDGDRSSLPYVVRTPDDDLIRISTRQASALAKPHSPGYLATLEELKQVEIGSMGAGSDGLYLKALPFPKSPEIADRIYRLAGKHLTSRIATALCAVIGLLGLIVFLLHDGLYSLRSVSSGDGVALVTAMAFSSVCFSVLHELGHAMVLIRFGQPIRAIGVCLYFGTPTFYTDSTLALLLTKRQRIIQGGAGVWVDFVVAGVLSIALLFTHPQGLVGAVLVNSVIIGYFSGWINLVPIMRLDGYWMLSDALGRPQLLNEGLAALRTNWRSRLGLYGLVNFIASIGFLVATIRFWKATFYKVLVPTWHQSTMGKAVVCAFVIVVGCSLVGPLISLAAERRRRRRRDLQFEDEHDDRVRAAEIWDELPWEPEFTEEELGVIAGSFELFTPEPGQSLITEGVIPAGVFVGLGPDQFIAGFESVSKRPSSKTVIWEGGGICAFLSESQARLLIDRHRLKGAINL